MRSQRITLDTVDDAPTRQRLVADLETVNRTLDEIIRDTERPARSTLPVSCDAAAVVRDRLQFWSVVAREQGRSSTVTIDPPDAAVPVGVAAGDLAACLDALIGNVFAHTPAGTPFAVRLTAAPDGGALLGIADAGAGLPEQAGSRRGESTGGSTGLGLDIAARTAQRSGGSLHIGRSPAGGADVSVRLGPPEPAVIRSHRRQAAPRGSASAANPGET